MVTQGEELLMSFGVMGGERAFICVDLVNFADRDLFWTSCTPFGLRARGLWSKLERRSRDESEITY
jgi:hypothetical protein